MHCKKNELSTWVIHLGVTLSDNWAQSGCSSLWYGNLTSISMQHCYVILLKTIWRSENYVQDAFIFLDCYNIVWSCIYRKGFWFIRLKSVSLAQISFTDFHRTFHHAMLSSLFVFTVNWSEIFVTWCTLQLAVTLDFIFDHIFCTLIGVMHLPHMPTGALKAPGELWKLVCGNLFNNTFV